MYKITVMIAALCLIPAGLVAARDTTDAQVRAMLDDLREWPPDSAEIPRKTAKKWGKNKGARDKYAHLFAEGGELQSIEFIDSFDAGDVYLIEFENARVMLAYKRDGKRWNFRTMLKMPR